jgi:hypothetical protein
MKRLGGESRGHAVDEDLETPDRRHRPDLAAISPASASEAGSVSDSRVTRARSGGRGATSSRTSLSQIAQPGRGVRRQPAVEHA